MSFGTAGAIQAVPANAGSLGQGVAYPMEFDAAGRLTLSWGEQSVDDAVASIVLTQPGERPMQPDYGIAALVFEPVGDLDRAATQLDDNIRDHEPRVSSAKINGVLGTSPETEALTIEYALVDSATTRTLTSPFFAGPSVSSTGV